MRFWFDAESRRSKSSPALHVARTVGFPRSIHPWARGENPGTKDNNDSCKPGSDDRTPASVGKGFGKGFEKHFVQSFGTGFEKHFGNGFEIEIAESCGIRSGKRSGNVSENELDEDVGEVFRNGRCKEERMHSRVSLMLVGGVDEKGRAGESRGEQVRGVGEGCAQ